MSRSLPDPLRRMLRRFAGDESGNVLMMFSFALVPIFGLVGAAVDYARATDAKQTLNAAIDSAALMAARDASKLTDAQLRERVDGWIRAQLHGEWADSFTGANVVVDRSARTVTVTGSIAVPTTLMRVVGKDTMPVGSTIQSAWGSNTIELALVLDNTGSMAGTKLTALKEASNELIKIMEDATEEPDQIRISIVPFSTQVRLNTTLRESSWLRYDVAGKVYYRDSRNRRQSRLETITKPEWTGCVSDRDKSLDVTDGSLTSANTTKYPATFCNEVVGEGRTAPPILAAIQPLTSNWTTLRNVVGSMTATGNTNVTIGAVWGMATLSPAAPFSEALASTTPRLRKYMILLTDGDNTESRFPDSTSTMDARTKLACTNIKDAGVQLYTIRVINGDRALLQGCATEPGMYHEVSNASQLKPVFEQIAKEISAVRLTQ